MGREKSSYGGMSVPSVRSVHLDRCARLVQCVKIFLSGYDLSQSLTVPSGVSSVPNIDENAKYKKVYFCTKLFKNTIFTTYEWWRFQRYLICFKMLKMRVSIENIFYCPAAIQKRWLSIKIIFLLNVFRFMLIINLIYTIIFVYCFTLNFFSFPFPDFL